MMDKWFFLPPIIVIESVVMLVMRIRFACFLQIRLQTCAYAYLGPCFINTEIAA